MATASVPCVDLRDAKGFPGYCVGRDGSVWTRIKNTRDSKGRISQHVSNGLTLKTPCFNKASGYPTYDLYVNGKRFKRCGHELVLMAFVGSRPEGMVARHLDGDPKNNHASNLVWGTESENQMDRAIHGTSNRGEQHPQAKLSEANVREILASNDLASNIAKRFGVCRGTVNDIKSGRRWGWVSGR